jgi:DNA-binding transcriptional LysR family regulator
VRQAKEAVLTVSNQPKGTVTVGMTPGISDLFAAKLVESCSRDCAAIRLNIEQDLSVRLVRRISSDDKLAFALVSGMECDASQRLISMPLAIEQLYLVGSPRLSAALSDPVRFSHLKSLKLVMLGMRPASLQRAQTRARSGGQTAANIPGFLPRDAIGDGGPGFD